MNLARVTECDIDFSEMAATLAKIARFDGRTSGAHGYSVAQHSIFVADALAAETGDTLLAGCGLLHDGHEYLIGDITRPLAQLLGERLATTFEERGGSPQVAAFAREVLGHTIAGMKTGLDHAIYAAAGIDYPRCYPAYRRLIGQMDERMLRAEGLALFGRKVGSHLPAARLPAPKLDKAITAWPTTRAELAFIDRLERYLGIVVRPAC